ncbi:PREDICTED: uncharacterized protein LOC106105541 [Papilio polytes]|uniref:uncharacterized protein LOC106105541 n=1 Tax=Papilio polytes TaxID=76194 RepID=UPI000675CF66|nr:PREDICTED: uncharacterized protein LOC106105541 [Papilio polytes]XP_013141369.1 PREDICTED: uncharacterized protein LOC106105541 [Papilio polytes]
MGEIARILTLVNCHGRASHSITKQLSTCLKRPLVYAYPLTVNSDRSAHTQYITRNIKHISNDKIKLTVDPQTMKCAEPLNKPMCIMLSWLLSKPKHVLKYAELYLEQGYDVISVFCTPWQLMRPMNGVKLVARDLIKFMANNGNKFVVHGFSVGGYVWSEGLVYAVKNKKIYQPVLDRVEAQVWDSVADLTAVTVGVPHALFPNNKLLRSTLHSTLELYLKVFSSVTAQYKLASDTYYSTPCRAPGLFLLSSSDPVGAETNIQNAHDTWLQMGIKCTWKCWKNSPHVLHYMHHPDEYRDLVLAHLREHTTVVREKASERQHDSIQEKKRATA